MGVLIQKKQAMKACLVFAALVVFAAVATAEFQPGEEEFIETTELRRPGVKGCHLKCKPRQCSVTIYQHCNYRGYRINLKPGSYNMHQLQRKHMKNDDISSIRFHGRCTARLYEHWKFTGKTWNIGRNDSCFTNNHMKEFSMLQIAEEPTQETELVQAEFGRFRGRRRRISWNDQMSSMKVFNHAGKVCHYDCRARDAKERATKKKAAAARKRAAEKAAKAHKKKVAEKKRKADMKKEKAAKKRAEKAKKVVAKIRAAEKRTKKAIAAWRKRVAAQKKKRAEKRTKREKKHKAFWKKRAAERKKKNAKREAHEGSIQEEEEEGRQVRGQGQGPSREPPQGHVPCLPSLLQALQALRPPRRCCQALQECGSHAQGAREAHEEAPQGQEGQEEEDGPARRVRAGPFLKT